MKAKHFLIGFAVLTVAGLIIAWPAIAGKFTNAVPGDNPGNSGNSGGNSGSNSGSNSGNSGSGGLDYNLTLRNGSRGKEVEALQAMLNAVQPANPLVVDGIFGPKTEARLYALTGKKQITLATATALYSAATKRGAVPQPWYVDALEKLGIKF